jgi:hypothetical protein
MGRPVFLPADRAMLERVLFPRKVLRLACTQSGRLTARDGALWVTFDAVATPARWNSEDHFLVPGQSLELAAGDVVVVSASDPRYGVAAFDWLPVRRVRAGAARPAPGWEQSFLQVLSRLVGTRGPAAA